MRTEEEKDSTRAGKQAKGGDRPFYDTTSTSRRPPQKTFAAISSFHKGDLKTTTTHQHQSALLCAAPCDSEAQCVRFRLIDLPSGHRLYRYSSSHQSLCNNKALFRRQACRTTVPYPSPHAPDISRKLQHGSKKGSGREKEDLRVCACTPHIL